MNSQQKLEIITAGLQEVLGAGEMGSILETRNLKIYWGTATTGKPHIGYFMPLMKIRDFITAGCEVKVLFADIHAFLDNMKAPMDLINLRAKYYEKLIKAVLKSLNVDLSKIQFINGSSFQKSEGYVLDLYKLCTITTDHDARKAGCEVVKQVENPKLSSLLYPCMQALDEEYLGVDAQFGGVDQRKIFTFAMKYLPLLGYKKRIHLMNPMVEGLNSAKMSSSDPLSKIDLTEDESMIKKKIRSCYCAEGDSTSGVFQLLKFILFPIISIKNLALCVKSQNSEGKNYVSFEDLKRDFDGKLIHPGDLKEGVTNVIISIIKPIREEMMEDEELIKNAYPK